MSFGWSVGDIISAVNLIREVANALDPSEGASKQYQTVIEYLNDVKKTLDHFENLPIFQNNALYKEEICQEVHAIKVPVVNFVAEVKRYEPALGGRAAAGYSFQVVKKLRWHFSDEKRAEKLATEIEHHMSRLDTLLLMLIL
jgi:hypothetical protein